MYIKREEDLENVISQAKEDLRNELREELLGIVTTGALLINASDLEKIQEPEDKETEEFKKVRETLLLIAE